MRARISADPSYKRIVELTFRKLEAQFILAVESRAGSFSNRTEVADQGNGVARPDDGFKGRQRDFALVDGFDKLQFSRQL